MRIVAVPGFTQSALAWQPVQTANPDLDIIALDVPTQRTFADTSRAIGEAGGSAIYLGYSMGGRLCLQLAIDQPDLFDGLVLVSSSPGIVEAEERAARLEKDQALAARIDEIGVEEFLTEWLAQPMFASLTSEQSQYEERIAANTVYGLHHQLVALGQGSQPSLWDSLCTLEMPVMLLTGESDSKYDEIAEQMFEEIPDCIRLQIPGGHALPLENPAGVAEALETFIADLSL